MTPHAPHAAPPTPEHGGPGAALDAIWARLTPEQRLAASHIQGAAVLDAPPGSGKTSSLVATYLYGVQQGGDVDTTLAITFSADAADEMQHRLAKALGESTERLERSVCTFHSLGYRILREQHALGQAPDVASDLDQKNILRDYLRQEGANAPQEEVQLLLDRIGAWKESGKTPRDVILEVVELGEHATESDRFHALGYEWYWERMMERNLIDYDDMILRPLLLLEENEDVRDAYQSRWHRVLIDEGQDTSVIQMRLALTLAMGHGNAWCVHDPRQRIYEWRNASPRALELFFEAFPDAARYGLTRNFRSQPAIVAFANRLARRINPALAPMRATRPDQGGRVRLHLGLNPDDHQAQRVVKIVEDAVCAGRDLRDIAILSRVNAVLGNYEEPLRRAGVPYQIVGGRSAYARREVTVLLRLARLLESNDPEALRDLLLAHRHPWFTYLGKEFTKYLFQAFPDDPVKGLAHAEFRDARGVLRSSQNRAAAEAHQNLVALRAHYLARATLRDRLFVLARQGGLRQLVEQHVADFAGNLETADRWVYVQSRLQFLRELADDAADYPDLAAFEAHVRRMVEAADESNPNAEAVRLMSVHACVHPDTFVETPDGLRRIRDIQAEGLIATPSGPQPYREKFARPAGRALRIVTRLGYEVTVSPEHGVTVWRNGAHARVEARDLRERDLVRLNLGWTFDPEPPAMPAPPEHVNARARRHTVPPRMTGDLAEFLGLFVADGTLYGGGFRLIKQHPSVVKRFTDLSKNLFGLDLKAIQSRNTPGVEASSTYLAAWLKSVGGLAPKQKDVPDVILRSPLAMQARFLRGLFEDGTVNVKGNRVDHIHWENRDEKVARTVQTMLLRFGIVASHKRRKVTSSYSSYISTLYLYGANAKRFRDEIGFVADEKNRRLREGTYAATRGYTLPISRAELDKIRSFITVYDLQNGRFRGALSRAKFQAFYKESREPFLAERLRWHYDAIGRIEDVECETMCVSVPNGERFLQNGFDGWNSKGLEWPVVVFAGLNEGMCPVVGPDTNQAEELRVFYVAATRAEDELHLLASPGRESRYLDLAYLPTALEDLRDAHAVSPGGDPPPAAAAAEPPPSGAWTGGATAAGDAGLDDDAA